MLIHMKKLSYSIAACIRFVATTSSFFFVALSFSTLATAKNQPFSFALMGDQPYNDFLEPATDSLIKSINADPSLQWILHVGDIKGGGEPCTDELLKRRIAQIQGSEKPLVYVPGDNEWTDCHRDSNGNYDSQERLGFLRQQAFTQARTLGQKSFPVRQQTSQGFPEHLMWLQGSTLFIALNVPGSNNDLSNPASRKTTAKKVRQLFMDREKAIDSWLAQAEQLFTNTQSAPTETVIAIQGNPIDGSGTAWNLDALLRTGNGYESFMRRLSAYINNTGRPLLLAHGDTHRYKWDKPDLKDYGGTATSNALFYRVEGWGHPFVNSWVKITITPGNASPFEARSFSETAKPSN